MFKVLGRAGAARWCRPLSAVLIQVSLAGFVASAAASTLTQDALAPGETITQRFLTNGASVVEMGAARSCRVFQSIDVRASSYLGPDGTPVPFLDVARSPAAGIWQIGPTRATADTDEPAGPARLRIVLKYPVETLQLRIGARSVPLTDDLDRAGDSVTLPAAAQAALEAAFRTSRIVELVGTSRDTGRTVTDVLVPFAPQDLDACAAFEAGEVTLEEIERSALPVTATSAARAPRLLVGAVDADGDPLQAAEGLAELVFRSPDGRRRHHGPIRVLYGERLPGAPDPAKLIGCRMTDLGGEIERYRIERVEGFVSQAGEAWITRDAGGEVRQIYIPGVFEALRAPGTQSWTADVSIAAFANDPFEEPELKGCLGSQSIAMVGPAEDLSEALAAVAGLGGGDPVAMLRDTGGGPLAAGGGGWGGSPSRSGGGFGLSGGGTSVGGSTGGGSGGGTSIPPFIVVGGGGGGDPGPGTPGGDPNHPDDPHLVTAPLPFGFVLLLSGMAGLFLARRRT
jgi:hypothetical protein